MRFLSRIVPVVLGLPILLSGCVPPPAPQRDETALEEMLRSLEGADPAEARILAREAVRYSLKLRRRYRAGDLPRWHNLLVNAGIRKRGLCWHWADDLYRHLRSYSFRSLRILPVGANVGSYWREHNALGVFPVSGAPLPRRGILLDPWRGGGRLYFVPLDRDPDYSWRVRWERLSSPDSPGSSRRASRSLAR